MKMRYSKKKQDRARKLNKELEIKINFARKNGLFGKKILNEHELFPGKGQDAQTSEVSSESPRTKLQKSIFQNHDKNRKKV